MTIRKSVSCYKPNAEKPFKLSRTKIDDFIKCPRCFYIDRRLGVAPPFGPAFTLNIAVDALLKKEFDHYRNLKQKHPLQEKHNIDAIPFEHEKMDDWRNNRIGVQYLHPGTNFALMGSVDDLWINSSDEVIVVDYKATSKAGKIDLSTGWGPAYKRQMEFYQWLLRKNGLTVSNTGYFVYANGIKTRDRFDEKLEFYMEVIPHDGDDSWVDDTVSAAKQCLDGNEVPESNNECGHCEHHKDLEEVLQNR